MHTLVTFQIAQDLSVIYPLATELLSRDVPSDIRQPLKAYFERVGYVKRIVEIETSSCSPSGKACSPSSTFF